MIFKEDIAMTTAELLLKIKAVKLSPKDLFTWASGIKSPIYTDNRVTLSYHDIRTFIRQNFVSAIEITLANPHELHSALPKDTNTLNKAQFFNWSTESSA